MLKIVVVDDYKLIRQMICEYLETYRPEWNIIGQAGNGAEALEVIKNTNPDIVIMDVHMPIMDGITTTKKLKTWSSSPIVINYSGMSNDILINQSLEAGAYACFRKPFELKEIIKTIDNIVIEEVKANLA